MSGSIGTLSVARRVRHSSETLESAMTDLDAWANARRFDGRRDAHVDRHRWPNGAGLAVSFVLNLVPKKPVPPPPPCAPCK